MVIQDAVQAAVREKGYEIVRDYLIEIVILVVGASSGVRGGLRQFCFLAAWILFFDCILLFTFYTAILSVKLEINRIKRHMALRAALEEDGVSRRVAENVARSNEWPKLQGDEAKDGPRQVNTSFSIFRGRIADSSVPKFKLLMVSGFFFINIVNLCTIPFRTGNRYASGSAVSGFSSVVTAPPMDPFKVAGNGLDVLRSSAVGNDMPTLVTVLGPIKYTLKGASYRSSESAPASKVFYPPTPSDIDDDDQPLESVGGKVVASLLKSLEDPVLSKWIILTLAMSLVLNGYLYNAARLSIKDSHTSSVIESQTVSDGYVAPVQDREIPAIITSGAHSGLNDGSERLRPSAQGDIIHPLPKNLSESEQGMQRPRSSAECEQMLKEKKAAALTDAELVSLTLRGKIPGHALEKTLGDTTRAVKIRRSVVSRTPATQLTTALLEKSLLPYENYDYAQVLGACCENVIGYMPLPLGVAGPMIIDGQQYYLPMATTEGVLVASTSRGCKAINAGGGAITVLTGDGMTRGPCISFETLERAGAAKLWLDSDVGQRTMKKAFDLTSRFARLQSMKTAIAGTLLYIRFKTTTGDAMGMNMISKGVEHALSVMAAESGFDDMAIVSLSGNYCTDKKAAAINWIDGRGKGVVAEAIVPADVVRSVLKTDVASLVELNISKNLIGSAMAGSIGGFNAHAANIVTAIFIATGQDPAQVIESSNCLTTMRQ
jgi:hydroxymethylglutaryl-CoA reductase (NADPH)